MLIDRLAELDLVEEFIKHNLSDPISSVEIRNLQNLKGLIHFDKNRLMEMLIRAQDRIGTSFKNCFDYFRV